MVLLQPNSISNTPGAGGGFCNDGITPRNPKKYTPAEAQQRKKEKAKASYEKKKGTETEIGKIPMVVRTAWEQAGKPEGNLKSYMLKLFWEDINSSPAEARAT